MKLFPQVRQKKTLVSNGVGNVSWQNLTIPIPDMMGDITNLPNTISDIRVRFDDTHYIYSISPSFNAALNCYESSNATYVRGNQFLIVLPSPFNQAYYDVLSSIKRIEIWVITGSSGWVKHTNITGVSINNYNIEADGWSVNFTGTPNLITPIGADAISQIRYVPFKS